MPAVVGTGVQHDQLACLLHGHAQLVAAQHVDLLLYLQQQQRDRRVPPAQQDQVNRVRAPVEQLTQEHEAAVRQLVRVVDDDHLACLERLEGLAQLRDLLLHGAVESRLPGRFRGLEELASDGTDVEVLVGVEPSHADVGVVSCPACERHGLAGTGRGDHQRQRSFHGDVDARQQPGTLDPGLRHHRHAVETLPVVCRSPEVALPGHGLRRRAHAGPSLPVGHLVQNVHRVRVSSSTPSD